MILCVTSPEECWRLCVWLCIYLWLLSGTCVYSLRERMPYDVCGCVSVMACEHGCVCVFSMTTGNISCTITKRKDKSCLPVLCSMQRSYLELEHSGIMQVHCCLQLSWELTTFMWTGGLAHELKNLPLVLGLACAPETCFKIDCTLGKRLDPLGRPLHIVMTSVQILSRPGCHSQDAEKFGFREWLSMDSIVIF